MIRASRSYWSRRSSSAAASVAPEQGGELYGAGEHLGPLRRHRPHREQGVPHGEQLVEELLRVVVVGLRHDPLLEPPDLLGEVVDEPLLHVGEGRDQGVEQRRRARGPQPPGIHACRDVPGLTQERGQRHREVARPMERHEEARTDVEVELEVVHVPARPRLGAVQREVEDVAVVVQPRDVVAGQPVCGRLGVHAEDIAQQGGGRLAGLRDVDPDPVRPSGEDGADVVEGTRAHPAGAAVEHPDRDVRHVRTLPRSGAARLPSGALAQAWARPSAASNHGSLPST